MRKPKIGEVLFSLNVGEEARNKKQTLTKVTVTKVGRKYFYCHNENWFQQKQYLIENWIEICKYSETSILYEK